MIIDQVNRDNSIGSLFRKMDEVYTFLTRKELRDIASMKIVVERITRQTLECSYFIQEYSGNEKFRTLSLNCNTYRLRSHLFVKGRDLSRTCCLGRTTAFKVLTVLLTNSCKSSSTGLREIRWWLCIGFGTVLKHCVSPSNHSGSALLTLARYSGRLGPPRYAVC